MYKRFEELMQKKGVNATQVSKETGIPRTFFSDWKSGRYQPKTDKLKKIADYFEVPLDYLLYENYIYHKEDTSKYYEDVKTAIMAQEMFDDPDMKTLYHIKKTIEPEKFKAHIDMIKALYKIEHPEEFPQD